MANPKKIVSYTMPKEKYVNRLLTTTYPKRQLPIGKQWIRYENLNGTSKTLGKGAYVKRESR